MGIGTQCVKLSLSEYKVPDCSLTECSVRGLSQQTRNHRNNYEGLTKIVPKVGQKLPCDKKLIF